ncbi:MAG: hypothetical protein QM572_03385, partial [Nocardioides sp.]|uniref:hypothetical protein n=1 Tax=Nocardioides sp. TaxID=35761 RepID=UPI0039E2F4AD
MWAVALVLAVAAVVLAVLLVRVRSELVVARERVAELESERSTLIGAFDAAGLVAPVLALDRSGRTLRVARQAARAV